MKLGFINFSSLKYDVATPYKKPLGGSESAMCYLSVELAKLGHQVTLFATSGGKTKKLGVNNIPIKYFPKFASGLDYLIVQNSPLNGFQIRYMLGPRTRLILWSQHDTNQQAVESLKSPEVMGSYDGYALISDWQRKNYIREFKFSSKKSTVLRNAISPAFENLFSGKKSLASSKPKDPVLVYTSTPFRGLNLLLQIFPTIKSLFPGAKLRIFSSLAVYHVSKVDDERINGNLYRQSRNMPGVEYVGSVSQTRLAKELSGATILAYPNIFPETGCTSAMEAMAAGLYVVTSKLGALPETTAGFGKLIKIDNNWQRYGDEFIRAVTSFIKNPKDMTKQVAWVNKNCTWSVRAKEWEKWIRILKS